MIKIRDISKQFTIKNNIVKALSNINLEILEKIVLQLLESQVLAKQH